MMRIKKKSPSVVHFHTYIKHYTNPSLCHPHSGKWRKHVCCRVKALRYSPPLTINIHEYNCFLFTLSVHYGALDFYFHSFISTALAFPAFNGNRCQQLQLIWNIQIDFFIAMAMPSQ